MVIGGYYALVLVVFNCGTVTNNLPLRLYNSKIKKTNAYAGRERKRQLYFIFHTTSLRLLLVV